MNRHLESKTVLFNTPEEHRDFVYEFALNYLTWYPQDVFDLEETDPSEAGRASYYRNDVPRTELLSDFGLDLENESPNWELWSLDGPDNFDGELPSEFHPAQDIKYPCVLKVTEEYRGKARHFRGYRTTFINLSDALCQTPTPSKRKLTPALKAHGANDSGATYCAPTTTLPAEASNLQAARTRPMSFAKNCPPCTLK